MPRIDAKAVLYWSQVAAELAAAPRGERSARIEAARLANGLGSHHAVYRRLKEFGGWQSGRARRADAGRMTMDEDTLKVIAACVGEGARADGRQIMSVGLATSLAAQSGFEVPVSASQVCRYLRARQMDQVGQARAEHFSELRSLHPNHVHQVDPSLCVLYYMGGEQRIMRAAAFNKNKPGNAAKVQAKCWRYVLTDHFSGFIVVRYVVQAGESQASMFEFLMDAWGQQAGELLHGLPKILMWDKGSANIAHGIQNLLAALEVESITHAAERANVKGQVENAQRIVERGFESRLRFEPVGSVEALNARAAEWAAGYNANLLPRLDTRIRRTGALPKVRADLWLKIRAEQLRLCPPRELCARLLEGRAEVRQIRAQALFTFPHPAFGRALRYSVRALPELKRGDEVEVAPLLVGEDGAEGLVRVRWTSPAGEVKTWRLVPDLDLDEAGRPFDRAVIGEEYHNPHKRDVERAAEELDRLAYPRTAAEREANPEISDTEHARRQRQKNAVPLAGRIDAISHLANIEPPTYLPRRGQELAIQAPEDLIPPVPYVRALTRLRAAWGRPITPEEARWLRERYGEVVPEAALEALASGEVPIGGPRVVAVGQ